MLYTTHTTSWMFDCLRRSSSSLLSICASMNRFGIGYTNSCIPNSNDINKTIADRHGMIPVLAVSVVSDILMVFMQPTGPVESAKQESGLAIPHTATATVASLVSGPS